MGAVSPTMSCTFGTVAAELGIQLQIVGHLQGDFHVSKADVSKEEFLKHRCTVNQNSVMFKDNSMAWIYKGLKSFSIVKVVLFSTRSKTVPITLDHYCTEHSGIPSRFVCM